MRLSVPQYEVFSTIDLESASREWPAYMAFQVGHVVSVYLYTFWVTNHCLKAHDLLKCTAVKYMVCLRGNYVVNSYSEQKLHWNGIVFCSRIRVYCCMGKFTVHLIKTRLGKLWIVWHALRKSWQIYIQRETRVLLDT